MIRVIYYDLVTGAISHEFNAVSGVVPDAPEAGLGLLIGEDTGVDIANIKVDVATLEVVDRPPMLSVASPTNMTVPADGTEVILSQVPAGTIVIATLPEGQVSGVCDDGAVEISSLVPGTGTVSLVSGTHLSRWGMEIVFT